MYLLAVKADLESTHLYSQIANGELTSFIHIRRKGKVTVTEGGESCRIIHYICYYLYWINFPNVYIIIWIIHHDTSGKQHLSSLLLVLFCWIIWYTLGGETFIGFMTDWYVDWRTLSDSSVGPCTFPFPPVTTWGDTASWGPALLVSHRVTSRTST